MWAAVTATCATRTRNNDRLETRIRVMSGRVYIGTSGWNYKHWRGKFYSDGSKQDEWFKYYTEKLSSVEINNSFYQLPDTDTWKKWHRQAPRGFSYAVKASRYITHMKKLKEPSDSLDKLLSRARLLKSHLGPILFQLPPKWNCNIERLESFLKNLPRKNRFTMEFRDQSWWDDEVFSLLREHGVAFCIYHLAGDQSPKEITAPFIYIRLHGPGDKYRGSYSTRALAGWAGAISKWQSQGRDVYCYFDNDEAGYAAINAVRLQEMLS